MRAESIRKDLLAKITAKAEEAALYDAPAVVAFGEKFIDLVLENGRGEQEVSYLVDAITQASLVISGAVLALEVKKRSKEEQDKQEAHARELLRVAIEKFRADELFKSFQKPQDSRSLN